MQTKWFLWLLSPLSDIVKSPKVTYQNKGFLCLNKTNHKAKVNRNLHLNPNQHHNLPSEI
jgi:hypothetical protein